MAVLSRTNQSTQQTLGLYTYQASTIGDVLGDTRFSNQAGTMKWELCTVANAAKGAGTWVSYLQITGFNKLGIGVNPSAFLTLPAGSATAAYAPLKFTAGPLLTVVEEGAMEYKGHTLYMTTFQVRRSVVLAQEVLIARVQVPASSVVETTVYTIPMAANYLTAGKHIDIDLHGTITQRVNVNSFFTIQLKYGGATVLTFATTPLTAMAALAFSIHIETVCRSIGATGKLISFGMFNVQGAVEVMTISTEQTIDTTAINTLTITITANENNAGTGPVNVETGTTLCIDANT